MGPGISSSFSSERSLDFLFCLKSILAIANGYECKARCVEVAIKRQRSMLAKLRGGTAELRIETGRWRGLERQERICKCCESGEVEDVEHLVMRCAHVKKERGKLMELMDERVEGWPGMEENETVAVVMDKACTDPAVGRDMERLWRKKFTELMVPIPKPDPE